MLFAKKAHLAKPNPEQVLGLLDAVVTVARQPVFYTRLGAADTIDGRFDMQNLVLSLVLFRLQQFAPDTAQALFDLNFKNTERGLREAGIGDLSIPRHMKKMMQAFYGRAALYYDALEQGDEAALAAVLQRNLYGGATDAPATSMAAWVGIFWQFLRAMPEQELLTTPALMAQIVPPADFANCTNKEAVA